MGKYLKQEKGFYRYLFALTLPIVLQNLVTTSLGMVDTLMMGMVGEAEMAAVTAANTPIFVIQCLIFGLQCGLGILVSQYWGRRDMPNIRRTVNAAYGFVLLVTLLIAGILLLFPDGVMSLVTDNPVLIPMGASYLRIVGASYVFNGFNMAYIAAQRSMENPKLGLYALLFSALLNTGLNYIMIFGRLGLPAMGIRGAAWATFLSRVAETAVLLIHAATHPDQIPPQLRQILHPSLPILKVFFKYSAPVMLGEFLWVTGFSMIAVIMGHMDNSQSMLAGYTIAKNITDLTTVVCFGLANSIAVVIGNRIGRHQPREEIYRTGVGLMIVSVLTGAAIGAAFLALTPLVLVPMILPLFRLTEESARIALVLTVSNFIVMPIFSFANTMIIGILRAGGDTRAATAIDTIPQWTVSIPLMAMTALVWKADIVWIAVAMQTEALLKVPLGIWRIRKGRWIKDITQEVEDPS